MYLMPKSNSIVTSWLFSHRLTAKVSRQTLATCVKWLFNREIHCVYCCCPMGMFFLAALPIFGGFAWRARWCCKASHSEAWLSPDLTFAIPYCWREEESGFPYVYAFFSCLQFCPDGLWTLFTLGCHPRCFKKWWMNEVQRYIKGISKII